MIIKDFNFQSNTEYVADKSVYKVTLEETIKLSDRSYILNNSKDIEYIHAAILLKDLKNVVIDFNGATLLLDGEMQPFIIDKCENITIKNVKIEYVRDFGSEFQIAKVTENEMWLYQNEKQKKYCPVTLRGDELIALSNYGEHVYPKTIGFLRAYDPETCENSGVYLIRIGNDPFEAPKNYPYPYKALNIRAEGEYFVLSGEIPDVYKEGHVLFKTHGTRTLSSCLVARSKDVTLQNYRIINGAGMGILGMYAENLTIDGLKLYCDEESHGMCSNNADAMHLVGCHGKLNIINSRVESMMDDAFNIHTNYYVVQEINGKKIRARIFCATSGINAFFTAFGDGDNLLFYKGYTLLERSRNQIKTVKTLDMFDVEIELENDASGIEVGDTIENLSAHPEVLVKNCTFGKSLTHLRFQSREKIVMEDCVTTMPIYCTGDKEYWYEAGPLRDFTVRNCKFTGIRGIINLHPEVMDYLPEAPFYHKGIRILDNTFENPTALIANNTDDIVFKGNKCSTEGVPLRVILNECGKCEID